MANLQYTYSKGKQEQDALFNFSNVTTTHIRDAELEDRIEWIESKRAYIADMEDEHGWGYKKPCIPWGDFDLNLQSARVRCTKLEKLVEDKDAFLEAWFKIPEALKRTISKNKKKPHEHLRDYLKGVERNHNKNRTKGEWTECPTYQFLAQRLGFSEGTINTAFKTLEEDEDCELVFRTESKRLKGGKGARKLVALKSYLKFDKEPLLVTEDGKERKVKTSNRKNGVFIKDSKNYKKPTSKSDQKTTHYNYCISHSYIRLDSLESNDSKESNQQNIYKGGKPHRKKKSSKMVEISAEFISWQNARYAEQGKSPYDFDGKMNLVKAKENFDPDRDVLNFTEEDFLNLMSSHVARGELCRIAFQNARKALEESYGWMRDKEKDPVNRVRNPIAYAQGVLNKMPVKKKTSKDFAKERKRYFQAEKLPKLKGIIADKQAELSNSRQKKEDGMANMASFPDQENEDFKAFVEEQTQEFDKEITLLELQVRQSQTELEQVNLALSS